MVCSKNKLISFLCLTILKVGLCEKVNQVTKFCSEPKSLTDVFSAFCEMYETEYNHQEDENLKSYVPKKYNIAYLRLLSSKTSVSGTRSHFFKDLIKMFNPSKVSLISDEFMQDLTKDVMKKGIYLSFVRSIVLSIAEERNQNSLNIISKFSSNHQRKLLMEKVS